MKWLEKIIDDSLDEMSKEQILMSIPDPDMPEEMFDKNISTEEGWKGWKPITSTFDNRALDRLEDTIKIKLPLSYRHFLMYKHFYRLNISDYSVNLHSNLPDRNLEAFKELFFESFDPKYLIEKGFIYFADFEDYGLLCFDSNQNKENNEYPIVYIDHEDLSVNHLYAKNFKELLFADSERGNRFILKLNEFYKN